MRVWVNRSFSTAMFNLELLRANPDGVAVRLLVSHRDGDSPVLTAADQVLDEPAGEGSAYAEAALAVCVQHDVDVLWPTWQSAALAADADAFARAGTRLLVAPAAVQQLCDDKAATYDMLRPAGTHLPAFEVVRDAAQLREAAAALSGLGPLCVKPVSGQGGAGFHVLRSGPVTAEAILSLDPVPLHVDQLAAAFGAGGVPPMLVMPFLPGPELSVDVLADHGRLRAAVVRRKDDDARRISLIDAPDVIRATAAVVEQLGLHLLANVQWRCDGQGRPALLEVNARASGGLHQSCRSGVNLPWLAVRQLLDGTVDVPLPVLPQHLVPVPAVVAAPATPLLGARRPGGDGLGSGGRRSA